MEQHSGWAGFRAPVTHEYTNGPIWACSCYRHSHVIPTSLADPVLGGYDFNPPALNECGDAMSPETLDKPVMGELAPAFVPW